MNKINIYLEKYCMLLLFYMVVKVVSLLIIYDTANTWMQ